MVDCYIKKEMEKHAEFKAGQRCHQEISQHQMVNIASGTVRIKPGKVKKQSTHQRSICGLQPRPRSISSFPSRQVEAYDTDELNFHGGMRVSFGMQLMGAAARIEREIPSISWPFLLLHGDADKLCDIRGSRMMHENAPSSDKKLKVGTVCPQEVLCNVFEIILWFWNYLFVSETKYEVSTVLFFLCSCCFFF